MLDELAQARIGSEEMLADVRAVCDREALRLAVGRLVHLVHEHAVDVPCKQVVPLTSPDHLDDVPAGAAEDRLELLDDLAVAPHRTVQTLQVAVHDEGEVVETFTRREMQRAERLRLVALAVSEEAPYALAGRVPDPAVLQVAVETRLVDGGDRPETHRHGRELPVVGHEPRVRIRGEPFAGFGLAPEVIELALLQPAFEERARVDAGRCVPLIEDLIAVAAVVLAAEEVIEADLVEGGRRRVRREMAADALVVMVRADDHGDRVPADELPDAVLHLLVAGKVGLLLGGDRVDVSRLRERGEAHLEHARALEELVQDETGSLRTGLLDQGVERLDPFIGLGGVDIGELTLELV